MIMILPTEDEIKAALWEHAHSDLIGDMTNYLFSAAISANKPQTEDDYDELFDAVSKRVYEVLT